MTKMNTIRDKILQSDLSVLTKRQIEIINHVWGIDCKPKSYLEISKIVDKYQYDNDTMSYKIIGKGISTALVSKTHCKALRLLGLRN